MPFNCCLVMNKLTAIVIFLALVHKSELTTSTTTTLKYCPAYENGDGYCDDYCNTAGNNFDSGDCCGNDVNTNFCTQCQCLGEGKINYRVSHKLNTTMERCVTYLHSITPKLRGTVYFLAHFCPVAFFRQMIALKITLKKTHF
jgi:hypothetical protein